MKNLVDVQNLAIAQNKVNAQVKEEKEKLEQLNLLFNSINNDLIFSGSTELRELQNNLNNKMKLLYKNHETDLIVLEKNLSKYRTIMEMIDSGFEDVG